MTNHHQEELEAGVRFDFGTNWSRFLAHVDQSRIERAQAALKEMLRVETLSGQRFLDAGCGSGLMSLAARRLGANVHSFDLDPRSVRCTAELKRRFCADDPGWHIETGSVLDLNYLSGLGQFDIVYSWGVLHHTGALWQALDNVVARVAPHGTLFVAIYNDQGPKSRYWHVVKGTYNRYPWLRWPLLAGHAPLMLLPRMAVHSLLPGRRAVRGMSLWYDFVDWIGGFPFEVARPEAVIDFLRTRQLTVEQVRTTSRIGCNEFVLTRDS